MLLKSLLLVFVSASVFAAGPAKKEIASQPNSSFISMLTQMVALPTHNCVNPGGSCDGSVPCCDSYNNACFRGTCQAVDPQN